ncbi:MAG: hypothetical protein LUD39_06285 [Opitutae bacterium]|nr:hypothetical protein [Opitutae bacterium]MCD8299343.1 hypothetical protein [Opitutae bacterium]
MKFCAHSFVFVAALSLCFCTQLLAGEDVCPPVDVPLPFTPPPVEPFPVIPGAYTLRRAKAAICFGRIRLVRTGEDFKVRVVSSGEDLRVQIVNSDESAIGKWHMTRGGCQYKVRLVTIGEDFTIRIVDSNPGLN